MSDTEQPLSQFLDDLLIGGHDLTDDQLADLLEAKARDLRRPRGPDPINMLDFREGDVWETASGKRLDVMDRAFIAHGKRWVAVLDHDFSEPKLMSIAVLEEMKARRLEALGDHP